MENTKERPLTTTADWAGFHQLKTKGPIIPG
jgi:hypothetical protein